MSLAPGDRFQSRHWRQRGLLVEVVQIGNTIVTARVILPGKSKRAPGDTIVIPRRLLEQSGTYNQNHWRIEP